MMSARLYHLHSPGTHVFTAARPAALDASADDKYVNQHGKRLETRNGYPSRPATALLDKGQKAKLCILAREAFERVHGRPPHDTHELSRWRHEQQQRAVGLVSLCDADQRHWAALQACFLDLAGDSGRAFSVLMAPGLKAQQQALAVLERTCREAGLALAYPAAICRQQYKCTLEEASPKQLWRLVFTVKNRVRKKKVVLTDIRDVNPEVSNAPF